MPEARHYVVTQTREIKVTANNEADALVVATSEFDGFARPLDKDLWGHKTSEIKVLEANVKRTM